MIETLKSWWQIIVSFFSAGGGAQEAVEQIADSVEDLIEAARPIVREIDHHLKPALRDSELTAREAIEIFLGRYDLDQAVIGENATKLAYLPVADLLFNVAILVIRNTTGKEYNLSKLRLATELAYHLYKLRG